tara:strand:- start:280 stop:507 length:228 start_codon:yes stop_codon:yes gene_type:complete
MRKYKIPSDTRENAAIRLAIAYQDTSNIDDDASNFNDAVSEYASSKQISPKKVYRNPLVANVVKNIALLIKVKGG